jgi:DNA repair exonuclease SbcCD ATPase subunit
MKVEFTNVTANNFRSFRVFSLPLNDQGVVLIQGKLTGDLETTESNGAGKSSLFTAICWALYGRLPHISGKDVTGDDVANWEYPKDCFVKVHFNVGDHKYIIIRYRMDSDYGNKVRVWKNEVEQTLASNLQTQKLIEEILGIPQDLFAQLVYVTDASMRSSFSFETDSNRKKILVDVLPQLRQFGQARERVKSAHDVFNENYKRLNTELETLNQMLYALPDMTESQSQLLQIGERVAALRTQEVSLNSKRVECENKILDCIKILKGHKATHKLCEDDVSRAKVKYEIALEKLNQETTQRKIYERDYTKWLNAQEACPDCHQKITEKWKKLNQKNFKGLFDKSTGNEDAARIIAQSLEKAVGNAEKDKNLIYLAFNRVDQERVSTEREHESISESIMQAQQEIENLSKIHQHLVNECQTAGSRRETLKFRIEETQKLLETIVTYIDPLKFWLQGFGPKGVISLALQQTLDLLTENTNGWLHKLWHDGASIRVGFPQDDISKIMVDFIINGKMINITSLSSGQTRRLCLALCFGLRETLQSLSGWQTNLLVLDEVFDGLDNAGRLQVLEKIREIKDTSIFVISQFPHATGPIDQLITVQFDQGISTII